MPMDSAAFTRGITMNLVLGILKRLNIFHEIIFLDIL
jgi:hypothetical protein